MKRVLKVVLSLIFALFLFGIAGLLLWFLSPAPKVLGGDEVTIEKSLSKNAPFRFAFSSKMDKESVEKAFSIEPIIEGDFNWINEELLEYTPKENLKIDSKITISINTEAENWLGKNLETRFTQIYIISGPPQVTLISPISSNEWKKIISNVEKPEEQAEDVYPILKKNQKITLMFDRPIRPLETSNENLQDDEVFSPLDYLEILPKIEGEFKWLGTSSFEFIPNAENLPLGLTFEAKLKKGFLSTDGGQTEDEYVWHFETAEPRIIKTTPVDEEMFIDSNNKILIEWNQPVNHLDTLIPGQNLIITPELPKELGQRIRVEANKDNPNIIEVSFGAYSADDNFPLPKDTKVTVNIKNGVKSLYGTKSSLEDYSFSFKTLADPSLKDYWPKNNQQIWPNDQLKLTFSSPVDVEKIKESLVFDPEIDRESILITRDWEKYESDLVELVSGEAQRNSNSGTKIIYNISAPFLSGQNIKWSLKSDLKDEFDRIVDQNLSSSFRTKNYKPEMRLVSREGKRMLFDSTEPVNVFIKSRNVNNAIFRICQIPEDKIADLEINLGWWDYSCPDDLNTKRWTEKLAYKKNEWLITEVPLSKRVDLDAQGVWFFEFFSDEYISALDNKPVKFYQALFLSSANLVAKSSDTKVFLWATDFLNGQPVEKMKIKVLNENNEEIASGFTNADGVFEFLRPESWTRFFAIGESETLKAFVGSNWDDGISAWDFSLPYDWREIPYNTGYLYTNQPIYKLGQTVNFKGIFRSDNDAVLSIPKEKNITVVIKSPTGNEIINKDFKLNNFGSFSGNLDIDEYGELGQYSLTAKIKNENIDKTDEWFHANFWVEEYQKPDFKILLNADRDFFVQGEDFNIDVEVARYFGAVMPNANVKWRVTEKKNFFDKTPDQFSFSSEDQRYCVNCQVEQNLIKEGEGKTDENGKFNINFPINLKNNSPQLYTVMVTVQDLNSLELTNSATFEVYPAEILVGIKSVKHFIDSNEEAEFEVTATSPTGIGVAKEDVKISLYATKWNSTKKEGFDGGYYWQSSEELILLEEKKIKTGGNSNAKVKFQINKNQKGYNGELKAVAEVVDKNNNISKSSARCFMSFDDSISWPKDNSNRIDIITDKQSYKIGETAKLFIQSPFIKSTKALVTIERKEILSSYITDIKNGQFLELPITENMLPNVYVSVVLINGKGVINKIVKIRKRLEEIEKFLPETSKKVMEFEKNIANARKELINLPEVKEFGSPEAVIEANAGTQKFKIARAKIKTIQHDLDARKNIKISLEIENKSLQSELLGLTKDVDEKSIKEAMENEEISENVSMPEIKIGIAEIFVENSEKRLIPEILTKKEEYLPGEEVTVYLKVRDYKQNPVKNAELSLAIIDEFALDLRSRSSEDILKFFWGNRGIGISTASSLVYFTEKFNVESEEDEKDLENGELAVDDLLKNKRGDFKDAAYWLPEILTDENGEAETQFILPNELTTWQIWAVANTRDSMFGASSKNFITKKQLLLEPSLPKFAVNGDYFTSSVIVHNQTDKNLELEISLNTDNYEIASATSAQKIFIDSLSQRIVNFEGKIKSTEDDQGNFKPAKLKFLVENLDKSLKDEIEVDIPVLKPATSKNITISGAVDNLKTEYIKIPSAALENSGRLTVTLSALRTGDLSSALNSLVSYPYHCAEQIMSSHLINIIIKRVENTLERKITNNDNEKLDKIIEKGLQEILKFQKMDGGFGFWENSKQSYPELTSYILLGLNEAKKVNFDINDIIFQNTVDYLYSSVNSPDQQIWTKNSMAFAIFALSEAGEFNLSAGNNLYDNRDDLSLFGKISLLLAFDNFNKNNLFESESKKENLLHEIELSANQSSKGVFFNEKNNDIYSYNSSIRTTALALFALVRINPKHEMIPKIVDYLQQIKSDNDFLMPWETTQNIAWVLISYLELLENSQQLDTNFSATVHLNNDLFAQKSWNNENLFVSENFIERIAKLNKGNQSNELSFKKDGIGNLFYDAVVDYFVPIDRIFEKNQGVGVLRELYSLSDKEFVNPLSSINKGEILKAKLTIFVSEESNFLVVDAPIPAGFELINYNLSNEDKLLESENDAKNSCNQYECWHWWDDDHYFTHKEFRDDRILIFADRIPPGVYEYYFLVKAINAGNFQFLPATAMQMYKPLVAGNSGGMWFEVRH